MLPLTSSPTLHLNVGLAQLAPLLRTFVIAAMTTQYGCDWWHRCLEGQPEIVQEQYGTELKVRANSDPSFWIKTVEECWQDCFDQRLGPTERAAVANLRHYRNYLCHDSAAMSPRDVYQALTAIKILLQKIAPSAVPAIDELMLECRIQHPTCNL